MSVAAFVHAGAPRRCRTALAATLLLAWACLASGCAVLRQFAPSVTATELTPAESIELRRGDILTTGQLSRATAETLAVAGIDAAGCARADCVAALATSEGIDDERRHSATAELWLQRALADAAPSGDRFDAWVETARHAYAYLFFSARGPGERAFEDRQTQVRDWYNLAAERAATGLFAEATTPGNGGGVPASLGGWNVRVDLGDSRFAQSTQPPQELFAASSFAFAGLRSVYRRDGFGAELVAVLGHDPTAAASLGPAGRGPGPGHAHAHASTGEDGAPRARPPAWSEMPYPPVTVLLQFPVATVADLLATRDVVLSVHDPYRDARVVLHGRDVPLAADFTAGYGLWLARSGFNRQSLRTLFGRGEGIDRPHLFLMQPFDPDRRVVLMLHGLASSPEAWVNVANEIQGDPALRGEFQIWQVYYPTNMPVALNHAAIRRLLQDTLDHFDPEGRTAASRGVVLVGHSMGGMIARLMVSSADRELWDLVRSNERASPEWIEDNRRWLDRVLRFEPMPQVGRAIFIATPHRGTEVAGNRLGRFVSRLVRLPLTMLENLGEALGASPTSRDGHPLALANSIDNLDRNDPFVQVAADLPIEPGLPYHSIIARLEPDGPLGETSDGLVPYRSAHLPGAVSERVIVSGHSVQETPQAILEIRRILHEDIEARRDQPGG